MQRRSLFAFAGLFMLSASIGQAADLEPVTLAWTPNPQTPQIDIAIKQGLFKEAGLDVKTVAFASGRESFEALVGGQLDFAFMADFPAAVGAMRQQKFGVIADLSRYTGNRFIAKSTATELKSLSDLAGKKLGLTIGTNYDYFASRALSKAGVKVQIVNAGPGDLVAALSRGDIDAAVPFPTFYGMARKTLGADYRDLVSTNYTLHNIMTASDGVLTKRPAVVEKFMSALLKADQVVKTDPDTALAAVAANLSGAMTPAVIRGMWPDYTFGIVLDESLLDLLTDQGAWVVETGVVKGSAPTKATMKGYLADSVLRKLNPSAVNLP